MIVTIIVVTAVWVTIMLVRGDASQVGAETEGTDRVPKKVCQTPPSPSLSIGTSSGNKNNWRIKTVSRSGTYGAKVRTVAERGGEVFCYSSWDTASIKVTVSAGSSKWIYARWDDVSLREHYIDYEFEWTTEPEPTSTPEPTDTPTPTVTPVPTLTSDPCDYYDSNNNGQIEADEVRDAIADWALDRLAGDDVQKVIDCYNDSNPTPTPVTPTPTSVPPTATTTPPTAVPATPTPTLVTPTPVPVAPPRPDQPQARFLSTSGAHYHLIRMSISWYASTGDDIEFELQQKDPGGDWWSWGTTHDTYMVIRNVPAEATREYMVQARLKSDPTVASPWSRVAYVHTPPPFVGHQADHIVQYELGTTAPTFPSSEAPSDYDPADVIPDAINEAVAAWNNSSAATGEPGILICKTGAACSGRQSDGKVVTINVVSRSCSNSTACVPPPSDGYADSEGHLRDLKILIDDLVNIPKRKRWLYGHEAQVILWTNSVNGHRNEHEHNDRFIWLYLPDTVMHEFGHTLGLYDLYELSGDSYEGYLMDKEAWEDDPVVETIPSTDIAYMGEVYENHSPHGQ